jgi:SAM-dependent methyltransferase
LGYSFFVTFARMTRMLWNERYTKGLPSLDVPDPYFVDMYERFIGNRFPDGGKALDLAAGTGRHTLQLARKGWEVTAIDFSEVAIARLGENTRDLNVTLICADLAEFPLQQVCFDLIVLYYYFDRAMFPVMTDALKPGGMLICKLAVGSAERPEVLHPGEVPRLLNGLEQLDYGERPVRDRGVAEGLFRKAVC